MTEYSNKQLIFDLFNHLSEKYPDEQFLNEELNGILQGLINSLRWTALRYAKQQLSEGNAFEAKILETNNIFASDLMENEEILFRLENTSGLSQEIANEALSYISFIVDRTVSEEKQIIIENIGSIESNGDKRYCITLGSDLAISPAVGKAMSSASSF